MLLLLVFACCYYYFCCFYYLLLLLLLVAACVAACCCCRVECIKVLYRFPFVGHRGRADSGLNVVIFFKDKDSKLIRDVCAVAQLLHIVVWCVVTNAGCYYCRLLTFFF